MSSLGEYFRTDWAAMTLHDWIGLIITVSVFFLMIGLYVYVLRPKNRERFESQRHIPLNEERFDAENKHD